MLRKIVFTILAFCCCALWASMGSDCRLPLNPATMQADPMEEFLAWYKEVEKESNVIEAMAFVLGTVNASCQPSTRSMLAKIVDKKGIVFFGDLNSQKFQELKANPSASITFNWVSHQRQVSMMGKVVPASSAEAKAVFNKKKKMSQLAALMSQQGQEILSYDQLLRRREELMVQYKDKEVPYPQSWGGYRLIPESVEFWQAGPYNLHSRVLYIKGNNGQWEKKLLAP